MTIRVPRDDDNNNSRTQTRESSSKNYHYDCIIVGAGTAAMGVLRGLLQDNNDDKDPWRIAVVEQGGRPQDKKRQLVDWYTTAHSNNNKDDSATLLRAKLGRDRYITVPTGKGRGGTTRINAGLCCTYKANNNNQQRQQQQAMAQLQSVLQQNGVWTTRPVPMIVQPNNGRRVDYYQGLVEPLLSSSSSSSAVVDWFDSATCQRILHDKQQVQGVEYSVNENDAIQKKTLYAPRVIVAAGVFGSPVLLAVSGLVVAEQETFGLLDHVMIPVAYVEWGSLSDRNCNNNNNISTSCWNGVKNMKCVEFNDEYTFQISEMDASIFPSILPSLAVDYIFGRTTWENLGGHWLVRSLLAYPAKWVLKSLLYLLVAWSPLYWILKHWVKVLAVFVVRSPTAFNGSFRIKKKDETYVATDIQLDYLRSDKDVLAVQQFWQQHLDAMRDLHAWWEVFPGPLVRVGCRPGRPLQLDRFRFYCQQFCLPYFHWCGSLANDHSFAGSLPAGLQICDASTLHPLPPVPPALTLAARGYILGTGLRKKD